MAPIVLYALFGVLPLRVWWLALLPFDLDAVRNADHPCGCVPVPLFASRTEMVHVPACEALVHDLTHGLPVVGPLWPGA
eukprot:7577040-Heterocapsa_arctica.AAC.1